MHGRHAASCTASTRAASYTAGMRAASCTARGAMHSHCQHARDAVHRSTRATTHPPTRAPETNPHTFVSLSRTERVRGHAATDARRAMHRTHAPPCRRSCTLIYIAKFSNFTVGNFNNEQLVILTMNNKNR
jgi:hypothetical protein